MLPGEEIEQDAEEQLRLDLELDASDVAVSVRKGVVTLAGFVHRYSEKIEAEAAAKRVAGAFGVANDIEARPRGSDARPDPDIARDVAAAIRGRLPRSWDRIRVVAQLGWVTLEGEVEWHYQRETAERTVHGAKDARGVNNLWSRPAPSEAKRDIEKAFRRSAAAHVNRITLETSGETILGGTARSWSGHQEAQRAT